MAEDSAEASGEAVDEKEDERAAEWETTAMAVRMWLRVREEADSEECDREDAGCAEQMENTDERAVEECNAEAEHAR